MSIDHKNLYLLTLYQLGKAFYTIFLQNIMVRRIFLAENSTLKQVHVPCYVQ